MAKVCRIAPQIRWSFSILLEDTSAGQMVVKTGAWTFVLQLKDIFLTDCATLCVRDRGREKMQMLHKLQHSSAFECVCVFVCMLVQWQPPVQCWGYLAFCLALIKEQRTALPINILYAVWHFWHKALLQCATGKVTTTQCTNGVSN